MSGDVLTMIVALLGVGAVAGVIAGMLGVGGGIVVVPALYHFFTLMGLAEDHRMHLAVGTSLATIIPTSLSSIRAHWKRGGVDVEVLKSWGPWIVVGVAAGSALAAWLKGAVLTALFAVFALFMAFNLAFSPETRRVSDHLPTGWARAAIASAIGALSAMLGIGGGSFSVPAMTACGYPIRRAVGTAAALGFAIGLPGAIGFIVTGLQDPATVAGAVGYVYVPGFLALFPTAMLLAPVGARIAHGIDAKLLRRLFALFLLITALRMIYGLVG